MTDDITTTHLEAALIDQKVAGAFQGKAYAFIAVYYDSGWKLGIAVANERGYNIVNGKRFATEAEAREWARSLNRHICLSPDQEAAIVVSTMGGRPYVDVLAGARAS